MFSSQVAVSLMMKYILNETVRDIDRIIHKICRLLANLQLPTETAVIHSSQDIGNIERGPNSSLLFYAGFISLMPLSV